VTESENILIIREDEAFHLNVEFQGEWKKSHGRFGDSSFMGSDADHTHYLRAELIVMIRKNGSIQVIKDRYGRPLAQIEHILGLEHAAEKEIEFDNRTILLMQ